MEKIIVYYENQYGIDQYFDLLSTNKLFVTVLDQIIRYHISHKTSNIPANYSFTLTKKNFELIKNYVKSTLDVEIELEQQLIKNILNIIEYIFNEFTRFLKKIYKAILTKKTKLEQTSYLNKFHNELTFLLYIVFHDTIIIPSDLDSLIQNILKISKKGTDDLSKECRHLIKKTFLGSYKVCNLMEIREFIKKSSIQRPSSLLVDANEDNFLNIIFYIIEVLKGKLDLYQSKVVLISTANRPIVL